ncbi:phiSA1p31-related protein [Streptomyces sp. NPDC001876]|uniref:phiSA1p31-related protein n=1 Tax=Streptomyces sp. NPDC001876 TaxID=3154402 RepID=UPI00332F04A9
MTVIVPEKAGVAAGFEFDLSLTWIDTYGARWTWTGETDSTGMALMQTGDDTPERLSNVYWTYGPLIPVPVKITPAVRRAVLAAQVKPAPSPRKFAAFLRRRRDVSA